MISEVRQLFANRAVLVVTQIVLIGLALALAVFSFHEDGTSIKLTAVNPPLVVAAIFIYSIFFFLFSVHWAYALHIIEKRHLSRRHVLAFFASQPYKYLPSSIFSMSARSIYSKKVGASGISSTAKAQVLEYASIFGSGLLIIALARTGLSFSIIAPICGLILVSLFLMNPGHYREANRVYRYLTLLSIALASWLVAGLSLYLTVHSVGSTISFSKAVYLNAATLLASLAAVFVPAGIGVREAIFFSQNVSTPAVLIWRALSVLVDLVGGLLAIYKINKQKSGA